MLTPHEKRRGLLVLLLVVFMALLETAGVASVLPFLAVLGNPEVVETNPVLASIYSLFGFETANSFLMALGFAAFAVTIFAAGFRIFAVYAMSRFVNMRRHSLGERLLETYLRQPYAFFLNRHSGDMAKSILSEVDMVVNSVLLPGLNVIAYTVVALALVTLLIAINPWLALWIGLAISGMYLLAYITVQGLMGRIGEDRTAANRERFTTAGEALGGIKAIKLMGREYAYLSLFRPASSRFAKHMATAYTAGQVPKYLIEAMGVGGILLLALILMSTSNGVGTILPVLGLYAFAGYKLMPATQKIYEGFTQLRFGASAVDVLYEDLSHRASLSEIRATAHQVLVPARVICLDRVCFAYPNATNLALREINLTIPVGTTVGFVGGTGAGKTTLVDIILGLLQPTEGTLRIDDEPITQGNLRVWQNSLGYVPQDIFLTDTSIAENIALGVPSGQIDFELVQRCARMAQIHNFIVSELPQQYDTVVGERGVRLSGGQRQRIGIARALYNDPSTLVLDEATSALDNVTERAVMEAVNSVRQNKTVIIIAHRLTTVRNCDNIFLLDNGRIKASGTFDELRQSDEHFASMAMD